MLILEDITEQKQNTGKDESEEKVLALNTGENKSNNNNGKFFKV